GREAYPPDFQSADKIIIGAVGRTEAVKDPLNLVQAFILLLKRRPDWRDRIRLIWIGDGPQFKEVKDALAAGGAMETAWLPGARHDVPMLMRGFDVYVLPSLAEGISNTIMEAMAIGLPVVATRVGGNAELVDDGITGTLISRSNPEVMADAIQKYIESPDLRSQHGAGGRKRAVKEFSLEHMVSQYMDVYDQILERKRI
ncbi:MAG: glycosyltransferase, partial [Gammaproteobacteria bacterium]|nr:glycosyltransferase [Gammaproteobacteria bacterium]